MYKTEKVEVEINLFKKPVHLINEKCECSKEAIFRVVASYENEHRDVFCCFKTDCMQKAYYRAARRLFIGPRPLSIGPKKLIEAGAEVIETFKLTIEK